MVSETFKKNKSSWLLLTLLTFLPVLVSSVSIVYIAKYEETIYGFTVMQWTLFYFATAFTMAFALTPTTFVALVTGYVVGWSGLYGLVPSYILASIIGFLLASFLDKDNFFDQIQKKEKVKRVMENLKSDEFWVIFFCRLSPVLPFAMMNVFLSLMKVRLKNFIGASVLGMLPRTLLSVWIGTQATDIVNMLRGNEQPDVGKLLVIALLILSVAGFYILFMRAMKAKV